MSTPTQSARFVRAAAVTLALAGLATGCADRDSDGPQDFQVTVTELETVKAGSEEALPLEGLPAAGGTVTLEL